MPAACPERAPHALRTWMIAALMIGLAGCRAAGCERGERPADTGEIAFRKDAVLTFASPDGGVRATIDVEVAATDSARRRGLMDRTALPERSGMLFVYQTAAHRSFWMKDTPMELDLIFAGADSSVVRIAGRARPFTDVLIPSGLPARFVVEVPGGFSERVGISEGDRLRWRFVR